MRSINSGVVGDAYHFSPSRFFTIRQVIEIICSRMDIDFADLVEIVPDRPWKRSGLFDGSRKSSKRAWQEPNPYF